MSAAASRDTMAIIGVTAKRGRSGRRRRERDVGELFFVLGFYCGVVFLATVRYFDERIKVRL
jgi:hypothetical protein